MDLKKFGTHFFKKGFTLSEVLITLVIIGIIAAMTIPTLINKTQNNEFVSKFKKNYSVFSQATRLITMEEGNPKGGWASSTSNIYNMYKKHLNIAKDCGNGRGCFAQLASNCTGTVCGFKAYNTGNPSINNYELNQSFYKFILSDGTQVAFNDGNYPDCNHDEHGSTGMCSAIIIDVNGEKGPNTWGRDVYYFALKADGLYPGGCDTGNLCGPDKNGEGCACRVLRENAINY